jgi:apolipoprotein N-acyltransferase
MLLNTLLSVLSGFLSGLSFNFSQFSFLIWFSLVPFLYVISKSKIKERGLSGFIFGLTFYGTSIFWIGEVTKLGLFFLLLYLSLYYTLFSLLGKYFFKRALKIITLPCLWVILEFLKENIWCGFGWANLGYSQYKNIYLIQIIDLWGIKFISFIIVMVNVFIYEMISGGKLLFKKAIFISSVIGGCLFYSFYRLNSLKAIDYINISLLQPNISQELKWQQSAVPHIIDKLKLLSKNTDKKSLVVFPEAVWPVILDDSNVNELKTFIQEIDRDSLMGVVEKREGKFYNSAVLLNRKGKLLKTYHKVRLVPFGEYIPLRKFLSFIEVINSIGDMERGSDYVVFPYRNKKFATLICFEDIFPLFVAYFSKKSDFLINITNDAWFKGEPQASQHVGIMAMRAVENRISIVRCANTGISGWVSFKGRIEKLKGKDREVFFEGVGSFKVTLNKERSFYNKYPELFVILCSIFLLASVVIYR